MRAIVLAYHDMGCARHRVPARRTASRSSASSPTRIPRTRTSGSGPSPSSPRAGISRFSRPTTSTIRCGWTAFASSRPTCCSLFTTASSISKELLAIPPKGCFNLHGSMLPKYRGCAPANWAILNGETETGRHAAPHDDASRRRRHRRPARGRDRADRRRAHAQPQARRGGQAAARRMPAVDPRRPSAAHAAGRARKPPISGDARR